MGFRSLAPTDGEGATPVRRPGAVIVTHDGLGLAVAECDEVGGHRGFPFDRGGVSIRHTEPCGGALLIIHFWSLRSATKQESKRALRPGTPPMLRRPHKCHGVGDLAPRWSASRPAAAPLGEPQRPRVTVRRLTPRPRFRARHGRRWRGRAIGPNSSKSEPRTKPDRGRDDPHAQAGRLSMARCPLPAPAGKFSLGVINFLFNGAETERLRR